MIDRRKTRTRKARHLGLGLAGFALVVAVIAATAIVGTAEPAYACFLGIPCW